MMMSLSRWTHTIVVFVGTFHCIYGAQAQMECASGAMPNVAPWETEAETLWDANMLKPKRAQDLFKPASSDNQEKITPSYLSRFFGKGTTVETLAPFETTCASAISLLDRGGAGLVPVDATVVGAAMVNTSLFGHMITSISSPRASSSSDSSDSQSTHPSHHGAVFVVANGANTGQWFEYHPGCLGTLARTAADALVPSRSRRRALYLYTIAGRPVRSSAPLVERGLRMLQLVVEGEAWVWGGVGLGFAFRIGRQFTSPAPTKGPSSRSTTTTTTTTRPLGDQVTEQSSGPPLPTTALAVVWLRTVSLSPKVLQVVNVLDNATIAAVLASGKGRMVRSPERHYSPGFENYRTSKSSFLTGSDPSHGRVRHACHWVARLAEPSHVEWPQLLRYDPGDWYKTHRDTFHDWKHPNRRALEEKERTRARVHDGDSGEPSLVVWIAWVAKQLDALESCGAEEEAFAETAAATAGNSLRPMIANPFEVPKALDPRGKGFLGVEGKKVLIKDDDDDDDEFLASATDKDARNAFELALVGELLAREHGDGEAASVPLLGREWEGWLRANFERRSHRLLSALLGEEEGERGGRGGGERAGRPDLRASARQRWEAAVGAPPELIWPGVAAASLNYNRCLAAAGGDTAEVNSRKGDEEEIEEEVAEEDNAEDVLGPPWVEPNRHCTLMFYLNDPPHGGGETTFPLSSTKGVVKPSGEIAYSRPKPTTPRAAATAAATTAASHDEVAHPGMPECSQGLRVTPSVGGGALFYHKLGNGLNDPLSSHAGCPPLKAQTATAGSTHKDGVLEGVAWKINGFMWNMDSDLGPGLFRS